VKLYLVGGGEERDMKESFEIHLEVLKKKEQKLEKEFFTLI
jgi:chaperonin cofactor prefoldin